MLDSDFEKVNHIEQLMSQARFEDALKIISNLEKKEMDSPKGGISILLLKGKIFCYREQYRKAIYAGEKAYSLSQKVGNISGTIDSLLLKAYSVYYGKNEQALDYISKAETLINSVSEKSTFDISKQKADLLIIKSIIFHSITEHSKAIELCNEWLDLQEDLGEKIDLAHVYCLLGHFYIYKAKLDTALEYAKKSLVLQEELNNQIGIASSLVLLGICYYMKGNFNKALKISKKSFNIQEIGTYTKLSALHFMGVIYREMGEIDRTLRYYGRVNKLAEKYGYITEYLSNLMGIGSCYRMKGDFNKATEYLQRCLELSEKHKILYGISTSLFYLILTNIDNNSLEQAKSYLTQLEQYTDKHESKTFRQIQPLAKALILKNTNRIRNRTEAELLLKQIIEEGISAPQLYLLALVNLCELFLEELSITNNTEVLDELNPFISRLSQIAEDQNAYLWLTEIKLLQAKLALIQMKIKEAEQLLTQSQQIAEIHGLNLLAIKISEEHDILLEQLNTWNHLEKKDAPMSERIKLASFNGVISRMQGKRAIDPPKLTHEMPVLLLIIGEGGFPLFSNKFTEEWSFKNDLISGFLAAFNSFSGELFAKRLDRAKFGEFTLLMKSVSPYSFCYLFKGQTYQANQKLTQFIDNIQNSDPIWNTMKKYYQANRVIELKDHPSLKTLIKEIFIKKAPELSA